MGPLVSVDWLAERIGSVVVLDATLPLVGVTPPVDVRGRYRERHLPGAVFFDIEELSDHATTLPHMLLRPEEFAAKMSALGVGDADTIVVYEHEGVFSAPRARWMLRVMGVTTVYLLDGGLRAWTEAGLPVDAGEVQREPARFTARFDVGAVESYEELREELGGRGQVLDARPAGRFAGSAPEPRPGLSSGHMPGATSVPTSELVANGRLKDASGLREVFAAKGVELQQPIVTTCGSGVTAAVVALAAEICGATSVRLYDGSWAEYAGRPESVIEKG